jgi:hypothetical protein
MLEYSDSAMGWKTEKLGFDSWQVRETFIIHHIQIGYVAQTTSYPIDISASSHGYNPLPSSAEIKKGWNNTSISP